MEEVEEEDQHCDTKAKLQYCGSAPGTTGPVETKLASLGEVKGLVVGAFGEGSEDLHTLIHHLATSRVRVAGPQKGQRGQVRSEEAELAITTSFLRIVHNCTIFLCSLDVRNIVQGGDPLYAGVNHKEGCGGHNLPKWVRFFAKNTCL